MARHKATTIHEANAPSNGPWCSTPARSSPDSTTPSKKAAVSGDSMAEKIKEAGGLLLDNYTAANEAVFAENYPPGRNPVEGLYPRCTGHASTSRLADANSTPPTSRQSRTSSAPTHPRRRTIQSVASPTCST